MLTYCIYIFQPLRNFVGGLMCFVNSTICFDKGVEFLSLKFRLCYIILRITKENKWEEMARNECRPTALGYIVEALLGLCFYSILFSFISDVIVSLRKSYIFKISLAILIVPVRPC